MEENYFSNRAGPKMGGKRTHLYLILNNFLANSFFEEVYWKILKEDNYKLKISKLIRNYAKPNLPLVGILFCTLLSFFMSGFISSSIVTGIS